MTHDVRPLLQQALALHRAGQLGLAESHYQRAAKLDPTNAEVWHLLGVVAFQRGLAEKAVKHYRRAIELRATFAQAQNNLGIALKSLGRRDEAARAYADAIAAHPGYAEAAHNLGLLHQSAGDIDAAERAYRQALAWRPQAVDSLTNLGNLLRGRGALDDAAPLLESAARLAPTSPDALGNLALLRLDQNRFAEARELALRATALAPDIARWWEAAGSAARRALDADAAVPLLQRAVALAPHDAGAWLELALAFERTGDPAAFDAIARARSLAPASERSRWIDALMLPAIPRDDADVAKALARFDAGLAELERTLALDSPARVDAALAAALGVTPFQLHYLPGDHTARQRRFGALIERIAAAAMPALVAPVAPRERAPDARIRVGFASAYLHVHSVARYFGAWIADLDATRFERIVWHTGDTRDEWTAELLATVDRVAPMSATIAEDIRAAALDALIVLDVGLDPRQHPLAALRLAPLQLATFGHPVTTGLRTLDGFLSGDALERADAQRDYAEPLVRLPGVAIRPRRRAADGGDGAWLREFAGERPALVCLQNLIKLVPAFDDVLAAIARETGGTIVLFDVSAGRSARYAARLHARFDAAGVPYDEHVRIVAARPYADFVAGIAAATLVLDTPNFSGGATTLDAIEAGTPVVAYEGSTLRARQSAGFLRAIGADELVVPDDAAYVALVAALCRDESRRRAIADRMRANAGRLFDSPESVRAFERFLIERVAGDSLPT